MLGSDYALSRGIDLFGSEQFFDAILFDMDGTLVDSGDLVVQEWRIWADFHGIDVDEILRVSHGRRSEEVIRQFAPELSTKDELERFRKAAEHLDQSTVRAIPGAAQFIAALPVEKWALVTSAPRELAMLRLRAAGLPVPAVLVSSDDVHNGKPDPEGFLSAARQLQADPARCLVFEDAPAGIEAARSAGMQVIALSTTHSCEQLGMELCVPEYSSLRVTWSGEDGIAVHAATA